LTVAESSNIFNAHIIVRCDFLWIVLHKH